MSGLPYEFALALRYLRPKRTFVSVITLICILGVTLGVAVLIIVIAVMTGFGLQIRERLIGFNAHLTIESATQPEIVEWQALSQKISAHPAVVAVAPYINTQVVLETQPTNGQPSSVFGTIVRGIDPILEGRASGLTNTVVSGQFRLGPNSLLLPYVVAQRHKVRVGDRVAVYSVPALKKMRDSQRRGDNEVQTAADYTVRGILDLGMNDLNSSLVVTSLADAQDLWGQGNGEGVQGLSVRLRSFDDGSTLRATRELQRELGDQFTVGSWLTTNADYLDAITTEKRVMFYILFFIVIVAAFGIMSALITFVVQKTREIGVLKALGATPASVGLLFLGQTLVVGVLGVLSGLGFGMLALRYRNEFLHGMNRLTGYDLFPATIYQFTALPAKVVPSDVVIICVGSLVICILAGVLPAVRAAWLQPVKALRNE
ncbi:MAG TPA: ABC transporter permease [Verrucomicrobiota bacterium]|nr:hypothetical protein [Verrucomicrobiales bacterium]HRI15209.1 ABC transporter permease [Verrucomicrobiota bacterium]